VLSPRTKIPRADLYSGNAPGAAVTGALAHDNPSLVVKATPDTEETIIKQDFQKDLGAFGLRGRSGVLLDT
jgi:hypothetical protein